ncbi:hypothetical protein BPNPMPFG_002411 [Mesorhizobium sp. AR07]|uniref:hypothetical protein n=1 Tax=Mesorhizobium sp. AR07 TaxID=2865838 RepID=UPI002160AADC|nr:hypothetical protein [Mesorhizobium sp. AR07]UVK46709.1 hypothetical protein BPNPMPFG_002411 [Mesorhizobium sp. AR07]
MSTTDKPLRLGQGQEFRPSRNPLREVLGSRALQNFTGQFEDDRSPIRREAVRHVHNSRNTKVHSISIDRHCNAFTDSGYCSETHFIDVLAIVDRNAALDCHLNLLDVSVFDGNREPKALFRASKNTAQGADIEEGLASVMSRRERVSLRRCQSQQEPIRQPDAVECVCLH